jgi:hypothetical protein
MPLKFDAEKLPNPESEYVAWVDVMGTQIAMSRSIKTTANFIFKLHLAAIGAANDAVKLYPVMDGFYVAAKAQQDMLNFLSGVFSRAAEEFNAAIKKHHRFLIRGGLAFGPVIHGGSVTDCAPELKEAAEYSKQLLLGLPMVQAHLSERDAPPFGVYVHESARSFAPEGSECIHWIWWRWGTPETKQTWDKLKGKLDAHFTWCEERAEAIGYSEERIKVHKKMVAQYFQD